MKCITSILLALLSIHYSGAQKVRGVSYVDRPGRGLEEKSEKKDEKKEKKGPTKRVCDTKFKKEKYEFKCKSKTDDGVTKIKDNINYSINNSPRGVEVNIKYEQQIETTDSQDSVANETDVKESDNRDLAGLERDGDTSVELATPGEGGRRRQEQTETSTSYEIIFDRLVEYVPSKALMAYNFDNEIVQNISLVNWKDFTQVQDDADGITSTFSISSSDEKVTFTFHVSRANQGESASANKMKIDFRLTDFPWVRNDTYVALLSLVETERAIEVDSTDNTKVADDVVIAFPGQESEGLIPFGEFTWASTAEATADNSTDLAADNSTDLAADNLTDLAADNSTDLAADNSTDFAADNSTDFAADNSTDLATDNSTDLTADNSTGATTMIEVIGTSNTTDDGKTKIIAFSFVGSGAQGAIDIFWDPEIGVNYVEETSRASSLTLGLAFVVMSSFALLLQ